MQVGNVTLYNIDTGGVIGCEELKYLNKKRLDKDTSADDFYVEYFEALRILRCGPKI